MKKQVIMIQFIGFSIAGLLCLHTVSYTYFRAHETGRKHVCRLLLEKKKKKNKKTTIVI